VPTHSPPYQQAADRTHVESEATASHRGNSSVKRRARSMRQKKQEPANRLPSVLAWTSRRGLQVPPTYTRASRSASPLCHQQCHHHRTHGEFEDAGRDPGAAPPTCSRSTSGRFPRSPPSGSPLNFAPVRAQIVRTHPFRHEKGAPRRAPKSLIAFESGRQDLNLRPLAPHAKTTASSQFVRFRSSSSIALFHAPKRPLTFCRAPCIFVGVGFSAVAPWLHKVGDEAHEQDSRRA